jgi:hypothetical protein
MISGKTSSSSIEHSRTAATSLATSSAASSRLSVKPTLSHDFRDFRIVDGQQRLTTLSVAIAALRDVAALDDPEQFWRLNKKYLINDTAGERVWPHRDRQRVSVLLQQD